MTALKLPFKRISMLAKKRAMAAIPPSSSWSTRRTNNWIEITAWQTTIITSKKCFIFCKKMLEKKTRRATYWNVKRIVDFYSAVKKRNNIYPKYKKKQGKTACIFCCSLCLWHTLFTCQNFWIHMKWKPLTHTHTHACTVAQYSKIQYIGFTYQQNNSMRWMNEWMNAQQKKKEKKIR